MILVSFVLFAVLIVAWLGGADDRYEAGKARRAPALKMSELPAD